MDHVVRSLARTSALLVLLGLLAPPAIADAQTHVCGNGSTFTVTLPSVADGPGDSVTLPDGCRVYALLVSGYLRNSSLDELLFYDLAKFVLEQDGYVHWAWWNNLLKEYMARPLHRTETYQFLPGQTPIGPNPGDQPLRTVVVPGGPRWKAVPEEDHQFQADALRMLSAIRSRNPDAIIVVAGHSMGGAAVARLSTRSDLPAIDLLAPIDPVGNRSTPVVAADDDPRYNWTRWRAAHVFRGFRSRDCERNLAGACRNVGTVLKPAYNCQAVGPWRDRPELVVSFAPLICPGIHVDPGTRLNLSARVRRLYHRWQMESDPPYDHHTTQRFNHWAALDNVNLLTSHNIQRAVPRNALLEKDPDKTCSEGTDPRDPSRLCSNNDGHGEIIGLRGRPGLPPPFLPLAVARTRTGPHSRRATRTQVHTRPNGAASSSRCGRRAATGRIAPRRRDSAWSPPT
jgi:hypothetical protein